MDMLRNGLLFYYVYVISYAWLVIPGHEYPLK